MTGGDDPHGVPTGDGRLGEGIPSGDEETEIVQPDEVLPGSSAPKGRPGPAPATSGDFPESGPNSLASIGSRAVARLLDGAILFVPLLLFIAPQVETDGDSTQISPDLPFGVVLAAAIVPLVYETFFVARWGATPGKRALGIRVASLSTGENPPISSAAIRSLVPTLAGAIPFIGPFAVIVLLAAVWHPIRRGWHDRAAGTVVVRR